MYKYWSNKNYVCCKTKSVLKITLFVAPDLREAKGGGVNRVDREPVGNGAPQGNLAHMDPLAIVDQ